MTNEVIFHNFSPCAGIEEVVRKQISSVVQKNLRDKNLAEWKVHLSAERSVDQGMPTEFIVEVLLRAPRLPTIIIKKSAASFDRALAAASVACTHALQKIKGRSRSYVPRTRNRERRAGHFGFRAPLTAETTAPSFG